ncbi:hypothetical protein HNR46_000818 [Haloferula luteola]|uniref:Lipoprotein n=1 Tax=Haloferula luteola TaxID=595692 RepID=A0A840V9F7_9BACT|nr:LPS assembly lipoprotein LptE [Haloferula luteola]MBB5350590.1 hypothetical protein [Haloferula luteola]
MRLLASFLALVLASCAGYSLNGAKPKSLENVRSIAVPMFKNDTLQPRAEALATSAAVDALVSDGTYRIGTRENADAVLEGTVSEIEYTQIRSTPLDTLRPLEIQNRVAILWILRDTKPPFDILASGTSSGTSRLFVDSNLQTARTNSLPDALERASITMVSRLANGY